METASKTTLEYCPLHDAPYERTGPLSRCPQCTADDSAAEQWAARHGYASIDEFLEGRMND